MNGWAWLIWTGVCIAAALATLSGGLLLAFAAGGRRRTALLSKDEEPHGRCDCCGYRLEGLENGLCPECGWAYKDNRRLPLLRRLRLGTAGAGLLALAVGLVLAPQVAHRGVVSLLPDTALIRLLAVAPGGEPGSQGAGCSASIERGSAVHRALQCRLDERLVTKHDRARMAERCARVIASRRDEGARLAAARLLLSVAADGAAAASEMLTGLDDPSPLVRGHVLTALGILAAGGSCGSAREEIVQRLMGAAVCDPDETARKQAVDALGRLIADAPAPPGAAGVFTRAVRDPSPGVRIRALYALCARPRGEAEEERCLAAAALGAHDAHVGVREAAVFAMSQLAERNDGAVLLLSLALRDESHEIREQAATALGRLGRKAAPVWTSLLSGVNDENPAVQSAVLNALTAIGS